MNTVASKSSDAGSWREFYKAAILEIDPVKLPQRIAEAERRVIQRARELFQTAQNNCEEEQALDDAMHALHALRATVQNNLTP